MKKAELRISIKTNGMHGYLFTFYRALIILAGEICNPDLISGKRYKTNKNISWPGGCEYINYTCTEIGDPKNEN